MQQKPDQSVADYLKSFKAEKDVLVAQAGDMMFTQFVTNQKQDEIDEIKASGKTAFFSSAVFPLALISSISSCF